MLQCCSNGGVARRWPVVGFPSSAGSMRSVSRRRRCNEFALVLLVGRSGTDAVPCTPAVFGRCCLCALTAAVLGWDGRILSVCFLAYVRAGGTSLRKYVFWEGWCPLVPGRHQGEEGGGGLPVVGPDAEPVHHQHLGSQADFICRSRLCSIRAFLRSSIRSYARMK